jgi:O-antigen/teichoic acid export membrane protein
VTALDLQANTAAPPKEAEEAEDVSRRVARNSLWLIAQPLLLNALSVLSTGYIARKLGAADYGTFNIGFAQIGFFTPLSTLGLSGIAIRAIAQDRSNAREVVGHVFAARLLTTTVAVLLAFGWLLLPTYSPATRMVGMAAVLSMVCTSCGSICLNLFQGFERSKLTAQPQIAGGLIITLLSVIALLAGLGLPGFVAAYVVGAIIQLGLLMGLARRHFFPIQPRWDWNAIRGYLRLTPPFAITDLIARSTLPSVLDVMILGALFSSSAVGPYAAAIGLVARLAVVPWGIVDALYPAVAHEHATEGTQSHRALWKAVLYLALATVPISLCLTATAPTVLWILFGDEYLSAVRPLQIAAWILPLGGAVYLVRTSLTAVHRQVLVARLTIVSGVVAVGLFWMLIPRFGMVGAATALVLREVVMGGIWLREFFRCFGRSLPFSELRRWSLAVGAMAIPLGLLAMHYSHPWAVVAAIASFVVYVGALAALGLVSPGGLLRAAAEPKAAA